MQKKKQEYLIEDGGSTTPGQVNHDKQKKELDNYSLRAPVDNLYLTLRISNDLLDDYCYVGHFMDLDHLLDYYQLALMKTMHKDKDATWVMAIQYRRRELAHERILLNKRDKKVQGELTQLLKSDKTIDWVSKEIDVLENENESGVQFSMIRK